MSEANNCFAREFEKRTRNIMSRGHSKRRKQIKAGTYEPWNRRAKSAACFENFYENVGKAIAGLKEKYDNDPEFKRIIDEANALNKEKS